MLPALFRLFARLPLPVIHFIGVLTGWVSYVVDKKFARRIRQNLRSVNLTHSEKSFRRVLRANVSETGKGMLETIAIWFRRQTSVMRWVRTVHGWQHVEVALAQKKGIIFLTPHLGCYEITARYYADFHPITVLYRPARTGWLSALLEAGRNHSQIRQAPTTLGGVRSLLKALRNGEAVGILPDQVPEFGEGVWANFFGKPAYTVTLVSKLAETSGATILLAFGERLSWGRGYVIHIEPLVGDAGPQSINDNIERLVRNCPSQYLWSYKRFKEPKRHKTPTTHSRS